MSDSQSPDPGAAAEQLAALAERSQRLVQAFWQRQAEAEGDGSFSITDPSAIGRAFLNLGTQLLADPSRLVEAQAELWRNGVALWQQTLRRLQGEPAAPLIEPERTDRRFKDEAWNDEVALRLRQAILPVVRALAAQLWSRTCPACSRGTSRRSISTPASS